MRVLTKLFIFLGLVTLAPALLAQKDAALFDSEIIHEVRLTLDPAQWQTLRNNYLSDDYYSADFSWNGTVIQNIGIRSRGSGSRSPEKPNLTLKFNKFVKQKLLGHNTVLLKANNQDASMLREFLAFSLMRALGLPAPREAFARLYINGEFWGLYMFVENMDEDLLSRVYGESAGYLYEFNTLPGYQFGYMGESADTYLPYFEPKTHEDAPQMASLIEMIRVVNQSSDADFPVSAAARVDLTALMKLLAVESYVADGDGILSDVYGMNNFYLYRPPASDQFRFLPWDSDFSFLTTERPILKNLDVNTLAKRAFAVPFLREVYVEALVQVATIAGDKDGWLAQEIDRAYALVANDARVDPHKQCLATGALGPCDQQDFEREAGYLAEFPQLRYDFALPQAEALVDPEQPQMSDGGVVNAASGLPGLAPGSLASVYGFSMAPSADQPENWPLPLTLGQTSVTVNGVGAPLLFVSPFQVNFQIPWNIATGPAPLLVSVDGIQSASLLVQVDATAPGIFVVTHASDFGVVSALRPAAAGEMLSFFATGLGAVNPAVRDGEPASLDFVSSTVQTVTAKVNGQTAAVLFAGLAPGYAGLCQVNVQLPAAITGTGDLSLTLSVGGKESPAFAVPRR
ncbi:MAG: CotH kinase family protein [Acidobacteriota bacterium]